MCEFIQAWTIALCPFKYQHIADKWDVPAQLNCIYAATPLIAAPPISVKCTSPKWILNHLAVAQCLPPHSSLLLLLINYSSHCEANQ